MILRSVPNLLTGCNLCAGSLAIYLSVRGEIGIACWLVLVSVVFDGLDGWTARRLKQETRFGMLFDSAADFVSFAIAPSFIYYNLMGKKDILIPVAISLFIIASAVRLVRFARSGKDGLHRMQDRNFEGLPTTASAGLLMPMMLLSAGNLRAASFFAPAFITLSALMLSRIPFRKFNR